MDCYVANRAGVNIVRTDEACKFKPLEVCCNVSEEDCGQTKHIHHGNEPTSVLEPVLPGSLQSDSVMQGVVGKCFYQPFHVSLSLSAKRVFPIGFLSMEVNADH